MSDIALSANGTLEPAVGEVITVRAGGVLVFALDTQGRRIPLATIPVGVPIVGCSSTQIGTRMLVAGLPNTRVTISRLVDGVPTAQLHEWLRSSTASLNLDGRTRHVETIAATEGRPAEGVHIASDPAVGEIEWMRVLEGSATLCSAAGATLLPHHAPIPLSKEQWLTAGPGCRIESVEAPHNPEEWVRSLDALGELLLAAADYRQFTEDTLTLERLEYKGEQTREALQESIDVLASSADKELRLPLLADRSQTPTLAAAVAVARAAGLTVTGSQLQKIGSDIDAGRDPITALGAMCGARPREITLRDGWREREGSPLIVWGTDEHEQERHPFGLVWRGRGWVVVDPVNGTETPLKKLARTFESATCSIAGCTAVHNIELGTSAVELVSVLPDRPVDGKDLIRLGLRRGNRDVAAILIVTVLVAGLSFVTPFMLGKVATLFVSLAPTSSYLMLFGALIIVALVGMSWAAVRALALLRLRSRGVAIVSGAMWERLIRQTASWHTKQPLGDRLAQGTAINTAAASVPDATVARLLDTMVVVGSLLAIATTSFPLLISIAVLLAVQILLTWLLMRASAKRATERINATAESTGRLIEILRAVNRLRVAGAEPRAFLRWSVVQSRFSRADQSLRRINVMQGTIISIWPLLGLATIVTIVETTGQGFAQFITAQTATTAAIGAIAAASIAGTAGLLARQSIRKADPVLATVPEGGSSGAQPGVLSGDLELRDIVYSYGPGLPTVLKGVSLTVHPGEQVAIVGPSGCGKTTLMRIVLGLEDADSGVALVDGSDMASLNRPAVRRQIGSVLQSSQLLPGPLRDNVVMGRQMTDAEVWRALDAAAVGDDVRAMPMGLNTPVTDGGGTLSGGQRQRVLIARALAGDPRILVLDEATSALDNLTQAAVVEALDGLRITRIVVAHRLSTIRHADRIIVLDAGNIVDEGTFEELLERPGAFRELALRQQT